MPASPVEPPVRNGLHFNVNYTWSKVFDQVDNYSDNLVYPLDINANWRPPATM